MNVDVRLFGLWKNQTFEKKCLRSIFLWIVDFDILHWHFLWKSLMWDDLSSCSSEGASGKQKTYTSISIWSPYCLDQGKHYFIQGCSVDVRNIESSWCAKMYLPTEQYTDYNHEVLLLQLRLHIFLSLSALLTQLCWFPVQLTQQNIPAVPFTKCWQCYKIEIQKQMFSNTVLPKTKSLIYQM